MEIAKLIIGLTVCVALLAIVGLAGLALIGGMFR